MPPKTISPLSFYDDGVSKDAGRQVVHASFDGDVGLPIRHRIKFAVLVAIRGKGGRAGRKISLSFARGRRCASACNRKSSVVDIRPGIDRTLEPVTSCESIPLETCLPRSRRGSIPRSFWRSSSVGGLGCSLTIESARWNVADELITERPSVMGRAKSIKVKGKRLPPLDARFTFLGDAVITGDRKALRPAQFEVVDKATGRERNLKLWGKMQTMADDDLRQLWLHEMRQVQRVMSYAGARDVIVDILEFVEDEEEFGVLLEHAGQPLSAKLGSVPRQHWLRNVAAPRSRALLWQNFRRLAVALGIVHAQRLVHGRITADAVMTEAAEVPDFQLTGFEWSLWVSADKADRAHARLNASADASRSERYSFAEDWRAFGRLVAQCLGATVRSSGEIVVKATDDAQITLSNSERALLRRLVAPTRLDNLDPTSIARAIDDIVIEAGRSGTARAGTFVLMFSQKSKLDEAVYTATDGEIPIDEYRRQLDWVRADLDGGATLLVPRNFAGMDRLQLVSSTMVYYLTPMWSEGVAAWDVAVCSAAELRQDLLRIGDQEEHELAQPIEVATSVRHAVEIRARLGSGRA